MTKSATVIGTAVEATMAAHEESRLSFQLFVGDSYFDADDMSAPLLQIFEGYIGDAFASLELSLGIQGRDAASLSIWAYTISGCKRRARRYEFRLDEWVRLGRDASFIVRQPPNMGNSRRTFRVLFCDH